MEIEKDYNLSNAPEMHENQQNKIKMNYNETPSFFDRSKTSKNLDRNGFTPFDVNSTVNMEAPVEPAFSYVNKFKLDRYTSISSDKSLFDQENKKNYIREHLGLNESNKENQASTPVTNLPKNNLFFTPKNSPFVPKKSVVNERASFLLGYEVEKNDVVDTTWVTVYGFDKEVKKFILDYFKQFGDIHDVKTFQNANFLFLKYSSEQGSVGALSQNGCLLKLGGYNLFIGVKSGVESEDMISNLKEASKPKLKNNLNKVAKIGTKSRFNFLQVSDWLQIASKILQWIFLGK